LALQKVLLLIDRAKNMEKNKNYEKVALTIKNLWVSEKLRQKYGLKRNTKYKIK